MRTGVNRRGKARRWADSAKDLIVEYAGGAADQRFTTFTPEGGMIGRDPECHLILKDEAVSRHHCRIDLDKDLWVVRDLKSANGVFVNGKKVAEYVLYNNDTIRIGSCRLRCIVTTEADEVLVPEDAFAPDRRTKTRRRPVPGRLIGVLLGCLLLALAWHGLTRDRADRQARSIYLSLEARVSYDGESFQIVNLDTFDWHNVTMEVESADRELPYVLDVGAVVSPGRRYAVTASSFLSAEGTPFDPADSPPIALVIKSSSPESKGYYRHVIPGRAAQE